MLFLRYVYFPEYAGEIDKHTALVFIERIYWRHTVDICANYILVSI